MNIFKLYLLVSKLMNIKLYPDEYKIIFVGLDWEPTNIWAVRFNFDQPYIFIGLITSPTNIRVLYSLEMWPNRQI
jgi:hypothetical protein